MKTAFDLAAHASAGLAQPNSPPMRVRNHRRGPTRHGPRALAAHGEEDPCACHNMQKSPQVPINWQRSPLHYSLLSLTLALNPFVYFKFMSRRPWLDLTEPRPHRPNAGEHLPRRHTPASPQASTCHAKRIEVTHAQNGTPRRRGHTPW